MKNMIVHYKCLKDDVDRIVSEFDELYRSAISYCRIVFPYKIEFHIIENWSSTKQIVVINVEDNKFKDIVKKSQFYYYKNLLS